ncbi:MAG: histidine--tRNA ligase [Candidatus Palauibacterales bacterium]|nr:histidine--tRNA ligase [Candidatus Palauibacterales bacterium]
MAELRGLPGFRDFYPEDLAVRSHIIDVWRDVARRYGFVEFDGPPLEPLEIYTKKSGSEIVAQLYQFEDKGGRRVALRPEMTPTLVRMVGARARALPKPIRWFSVPQLYRYERQQRGRLREHFQLNVDILGETDVLADAELLAVAIEVVRALGLSPNHVRARVSDRRLLGAMFRRVGVAEDQLLAVYHVVDRLGRESEESLAGRLEKLGLDRAAIEHIFALTRLSGIDQLHAEFGDVEGVSEVVGELSTYLSCLENLGVRDYVDIDLSIVRGLAYYTGIVFELWDAGRELRAICGGGRYDDLLQALTGVDMPALGFGMGDVVLAELLRERGLLPEYRSGIDCYVVAIGDEARGEALKLAAELRGAGFSTAFDFAMRSPKAQFKSADQMGARWAVVIGPEELAAGRALIRDMGRGHERAVDRERVVPELREVSTVDSDG